MSLSREFYVDWSESITPEQMLPDERISQLNLGDYQALRKEKGACRDEDPSKFFPGSGDSQNPAKLICASCVIQTDCLEYALSNNEAHGVWGGVSERERRRMRRSRRIGTTAITQS